ncbi:extracellular solute-binding protein [Reyranella sp.]|uniref:extracellular solute-binding protein n=1 Tax=Reyranella sp. TaxID=1929291 RepID=UPI003D0CA962
MSQAITRRTALRLTSGLALGTSAAFASRSSSAQSLPTLRATHFGGPYQAMQEIIAAPFARDGLGTVTYDVETGPTAVTKMQSRRDDPPFDVAFISRSFAFRALNAGLLQKLEARDIADAVALKPGSLAPSGSGVALMFDAMEIMVDSRQVKEPITSWLDLWRPDLKGKIMLPAAFNAGAVIPFLGCIFRAVGGNEQSDQVVNEAFSRLKALKSSVRGFYSDGNQPMEVIERGDIAVGAQFLIRIANLNRRSPHIVNVTPKEGACAVPYDLCIPAGIKPVALAKTYINFALRKDVQTKLADQLIVTPSRTGVEVSADLQKLIITDPSQMFFMDDAVTAAKQREWLDRYTREVQS